MEKFEDNKVYHYEINRLDSIKEKKLYFILYGDFAEKQIDDDKYIVDEKDVEELIVFKGVSNVKELRKFFNFYKGARHAYQKINN